MLYYKIEKEGDVDLKKVLKIIPFLCIFIVTVFFVIYKDSSQRVEYYAFKDYDFSSLKFSEDATILDENSLKKLEEIAVNSDVILVKQSYNNKNDRKEVYYSCDDLGQLLDQKNITYTELKSETMTSFASTEQTGDEKQSIVIHDFLNTDTYNIYKFSSLLDNEIYLYNSYAVYYQDYGNLEKFYAQVSNTFDIPMDALKDTSGVMMGHSTLLFVCMIICSAFLLLLYFTLVLFDLYEQSKKIGCLKLLGFTSYGMMNVLLKKYMIYSSIFSAFIIILSIFVLPEIDSSILLGLVSLHITILCCTVVLFYIALRIINKYVQVSNILKNCPVLRRVGVFCNILKFIIISFVFLSTATIAQTMNDTYSSSKMLLENDEMLNYAVFSKLSVGNSDHDDRSKFLGFFDKLTQQDVVEYMYADFRDYRETSEVSNELESLSMASVDRNYLEMVELNVLDGSGNVVVPDDSEIEYFIFPLSKKELAFDYVERYGNKINGSYVAMGEEFTGTIYFYEDRSFNSFDIENTNVNVSSPIIRVISGKFPLTYFDSRIGLDIAGIGMTTALKFKVGDDYNTFAQLQGIIDEVGLHDVLVEHLFTSYSDYLGTQQLNIRNAAMIMFIGFIVSMVLYVMTLLQSFTLYVETNIKKIFVKHSLGFRRNDLFRTLIITNLATTLTSFVLLIPLCHIMIAVQWQILIIISLLYFLIDCLLTLCIVKMIGLDKINLSLKGR